MERKDSHIFLNIFIVLVIVLLGCYLYARYVEPSKLIVKEYKISSEKIPENFSGIKIVHISDIYYGNTIHENELESLIEKVNSLKPDIIIFTGNLIAENKNLTEKKTNYITQQLSDLSATLGKYAIKGNTDYENNYENVMLNSGFDILNNNYTLIYSEGLIPLYLCGLSSYLKQEKNYEECFNYFNENAENIYAPTYKIVLTHEGDNIDELLNYYSNIDLILGGNSLNGSILVPYYGPLYLPKGSKKYYSPHYEINNTNIYISSGIGTDKYPYRLFNSPSINLYRLKSL